MYCIRDANGPDLFSAISPVRVLASVAIGLPASVLAPAHSILFARVTYDDGSGSTMALACTHTTTTIGTMSVFCPGILKSKHHCVCA